MCCAMIISRKLSHYLRPPQNKRVPMKYLRFSDSWRIGAPSIFSFELRRPESKVPSTVTYKDGEKESRKTQNRDKDCIMKHTHPTC